MGDAGRRSEIDSARVLSEYKRLVLLGKALLPFGEARRIVGPDCAYHLYFRHAQDPGSGRTGTAAHGGRRRIRSKRSTRRAGPKRRKA